jgi:thioesterase domain-containing protein/acyl carrier protein
VWLSAQHDAITVDDRQSLLTHCSFSASESDLFGALLQGAAVCTFDLASRGFAEFHEWLETEGITLLHPPVLFFRRFLSTLESTQRFPSVRVVALAGDVVLPEDVRRWRQHAAPECVVLHRFSITETAMLTVARFDSKSDLSPEVLEAGLPVESKTLRLIDPEGTPVRNGETGELLVESEYLADGYWNRPEETATKFSERADGRARIYRTGDLGRFTDDGRFVFAGRADHQLKIRGYRVELREIDTALMQLEAVKEAACIAIEDEGEQRLTAFVVWRDGRSCPVSELRARLRDLLPEWKIPDQFHSVPALPSTLNGKVDRQQLRALITHSAPLPTSPTDHDERNSGSQRAILAIWERVLRTSVRLDDTFFDDLGGSSLDALTIVDEIHRQTTRRVPLSLLMELNTVRKLADYLDAAPDRERLLIAVQRAGTRPPVFCVSGKGGSVVALRGLAERLGSDQPFFGLSYHGFAPEARPSTLAALAACYVDAIREQQPDGPYAIAGFSAGGIIAFEIARQLARAGHAIAFLGMIDTSATPLRKARWKRARRFVAIIRRRPAAFLVRVARSVARRAARVGKILRTGPTPSVPPLPENRYYNSLQLLSAVQPWAHPVTLFLAREGVGATAAFPDAGWSRLCGACLEILPIDGEHTTILHEDVDGLAFAFGDALARARGKHAQETRSAEERISRATAG